METLLDVPALIETWQRERGLILRAPPSTSPFPDLTSPGTAYPAYGSSTDPLEDPLPDPSTVAKVSDVYLRNLDMGALVEKVRAAAVGKAIVLRRAQLAAAANAESNAAPPPLPLITVDLPCTFFMLRTTDSLEVVTVRAFFLKFFFEIFDKNSKQEKNSLSCLLSKQHRESRAP